MGWRWAALATMVSEVLGVAIHSCFVLPVCTSPRRRVRGALVEWRRRAVKHNLYLNIAHIWMLLVMSLSTAWCSELRFAARRVWDVEKCPAAGWTYRPCRWRQNPTAGRRWRWRRARQEVLLLFGEYKRRRGLKLLAAARAETSRHAASALGWSESSGGRRRRACVVVGWERTEHLFHRGRPANIWLNGAPCLIAECLRNRLVDGLANSVREASVELVAIDTGVSHLLDLLGLLVLTRAKKEREMLRGET